MDALRIGVLPGRRGARPTLSNIILVPRMSRCAVYHNDHGDTAVLHDDGIEAQR